MGCDIHAHFEIKLNGRWEHYSAPQINRNYTLFAHIAGVRGDGSIKPISEPKGLPNDLSITTWFEVERWWGDGHSHTWLNYTEIAELLDVAFPNIMDRMEFKHRELGYLCGNGWDAWKKYPEDYPEEIEDIRFICWFDN